MEFEQVVRRRRMVRRYDPTRAVARADIEAMLDLARRAPSAGHSQGWHFLVLDDTPARDAFWAATSEPVTDTAAGTESDPRESWLRGLRTAPVLIVAFSERAAYERRYAEDDKNPPAQLGEDLEHRWPVPYWHVDTGMAMMTILLAAVDRGLGACLFAVPTPAVAAVAAAFDVPDGLVPVGVISVGYRAQTERARGSGQRRERRHATEVVHYSGFGRHA